MTDSDEQKQKYYFRHQIDRLEISTENVLHVGPAQGYGKHQEIRMASGLRVHTLLEKLLRSSNTKIPQL